MSTDPEVVTVMAVVAVVAAVQSRQVSLRTVSQGSTSVQSFALFKAFIYFLKCG